jgi:acyl-CoA synthetase (AMP-forming)/AMP-acid ligase II
MTFPQSLLDTLQNSPDGPAFEHGPRTVSRGELAESIRRLAAGMRGVGLGPGRSIAVCTAVSSDAFAAHMAAHVLGCRVVGVRPGYTAKQIAHILGMQIDAILVDASTATPELRQATGSAQMLSLGPCPSTVDLLALPDNGRALTVTARPDDIALLNFTSGSTGEPKGCARTYRALRDHVLWQQPRDMAPVTRDFAARFQRYLLFGTLSSLVVIEFVGPCLLGGGTAVIPEQDTRPLFPYAIERYRITGSIITVPKLCQMLDLLRDDRVDVSSLRALMVSGSPLSPRRLAQAMDRLGPVMYHGYGQTEAGTISILTPGDFRRYPTSVGRPHPGVEISVRDDEGEPVPTGQTGEIYVRSPSQMAVYWGQPEETRDVLRDGWVRTRDLGHVDEEGFIYLTGRTRDVIIVNALVIYAGPIERVLTSHADVAEVYVVGTQDDKTGEAIHAFVVPADGRTPDHEALAALVRAELGEDSVPKTITEISGVPVNAAGKPDKHALVRDAPRGKAKEVAKT